MEAGRYSLTLSKIGLAKFRNAAEKIFGQQRALRMARRLEQVTCEERGEAEGLFNLRGWGPGGNRIEACSFLRDGYRGNGARLLLVETERTTNRSSLGLQHETFR